MYRVSAGLARSFSHSEGTLFPALIRIKTKIRKSEKKLKQHNVLFKRFIMSFVQLTDLVYNIISRLNDLLCHLFKKIRKEIKSTKLERKLKQEKQK